jgi:hypothetical protein
MLPITDTELITYCAGVIVKRRLTSAAIFLLEACKPVNVIGSQALIFLDPLIKIFITLPYYKNIITLLANRANLEKLIVAIEAAENERDLVHAER